MDHTLPGSVGLAAGDGVQLQHDVHAAVDSRSTRHDQTALTDLSAGLRLRRSRPASATWSRSGGILPDDDTSRARRARRRLLPYGPFDQVQLAIGQGAFLGTPLQLANAYAAFGNGGTLWTPRIVTTATLPDGTVVEQVDTSGSPARSAVDPADLDYVTDTLQAVVTLPYGTGLPPPSPASGSRSPARAARPRPAAPNPHAWFPAFAPADDPTIAVATVLSEHPARHRRLRRGPARAAGDGQCTSAN